MANKIKKRAKHILITIDPDLREQVIDLCNQTGETISGFTRRLYSDALKEKGVDPAASASTVGGLRIGADKNVDIRKELESLRLDIAESVV